MKKKKICHLCLEDEIGKDTDGLCEACYITLKNEEYMDEEYMDEKDLMYNLKDKIYEKINNTKK